MPYDSDQSEKRMQHQFKKNQSNWSRKLSNRSAIGRRLLQTFSGESNEDSISRMRFLFTYYIKHITQYQNLFCLNMLIFFIIVRPISIIKFSSFCILEVCICLWPIELSITTGFVNVFCMSWSFSSIKLSFRNLWKLLSYAKASGSVEILVPVIIVFFFLKTISLKVFVLFVG